MMERYPKLEAANPKQCLMRKMLKCNRILNQVFRKHLLPYEVTNSQMSILFIVAKKELVSQQELADMLYLEKSTISRNMRRLFERQFLLKEKGQKITMTPTGKKFLNGLIPAWEKAMKEARLLLKEEGEEALNLLLNQLSV